MIEPTPVNKHHRPVTPITDDLRDGVVGGEVELDMRNIGHLVGRNDAIDDCRPVDCEGPGDGAPATRPGARIANLSRVRSRVLSNCTVRCSTLVPSDDQPRLCRCGALRGSTKRHHVGFGSWPCKNGKASSAKART